MKKLTFCLLPITIFLISCGVSKQKFMNALSQEQHYDFRKVRWGMSQEHVALAELRLGSSGSHKAFGEIYLGGIIPIRVAYAFRENRLIIAAYIVESKKNVDTVLKMCIAEYGQPTKVLYTSEGCRIVYVDPDFWNELQKMDLPLRMHELSRDAKRLLGIYY